MTNSTNSSILKKLSVIQQELKAPKSQRNSFGNYNYRSCEDILEAVKPILSETGTALTITDDIVEIGGRVYVKATATLWDAETGETIQNSAYAREAETKKGMDDSQVTGAASSYARKYALNGLFCIDDVKDADATNRHGRDRRTTKDEIRSIVNRYPALEPQIYERYHVVSIEALTPSDAEKCLVLVRRYAEEKSKSA